MNRKLRLCQADRCREAACAEGFCRTHYEEHVRRKRSYDQAVRTLHSGEIDGTFTVDRALREDLHALMARWSFVCSAGISQRSNDLVPLEHAEFAECWCISFAEQIIEAQRAINAGEAIPFSYENTKRWVWERLHGIERTPRPVESTTTKP